MRRESTALCLDVRESVEGPEDIDEEEKVLRGWAAFKVAIAFEDAFGAKSFGLLALMVVFSAIKKIEAKRIETDATNEV
jgi:RNA-dependent RNA polymerase